MTAPTLAVARAALNTARSCRSPDRRRVHLQVAGAQLDVIGAEVEGLRRELADLELATFDMEPRQATLPIGGPR